MTPNPTTPAFQPGTSPTPTPSPRGSAPRPAGSPGAFPPQDLLEELQRAGRALAVELERHRRWSLPWTRRRIDRLLVAWGIANWRLHREQGRP